jgi:DNA-binding MarR family transcriptional regulator
VLRTDTVVDPWRGRPGVLVCHVDHVKAILDGMGALDAAMETEFAGSVQRTNILNVVADVANIAPRLSSTVHAADHHDAPLDKNQYAVLLYLATQPVLRSLDDIESGTTIETMGGIGRKTASRAVNALIESGYASRPRGPRGGTGLTDKGRDAAQKIGACAP